MSPGLVTAMAGAAALLALQERWSRRHRCSYCGVVNGHDDHCPRQGL